jgi:hypothetical protein
MRNRQKRDERRDKAVGIASECALRGDGNEREMMARMIELFNTSSVLVIPTSNSDKPARQLQARHARAPSRASNITSPHSSPRLKSSWHKERWQINLYIHRKVNGLLQAQPRIAA